MASIDKQLKDALSNIDWKIEIDENWAGASHTKETVILPRFLRDHVKDIIRGKIKEQNTITETIYLSKGGSDIFTGNELINIVNNISKKTGIPTDKMKISGDDDTREELEVSYKIPWTTLKLDELAKLIFNRTANTYKTDFATMIRISETKEVYNG